MKTLEEFIPLWTENNRLINAEKPKNIEERMTVAKRTERGLHINYTEATCCAVGEAHNHKNREWVSQCQECHDLGFSVYSVLIGPRKQFMTYKKALYSHMKKRHPEFLK